MAPAGRAVPGRGACGRDHWQIVPCQAYRGLGICNQACQGPTTDSGVHFHPYNPGDGGDLF